ncbi:ABC-F family ATP-binding cassette domain-containing protein [Vibrio sonorensis]|uniref:ABC-F family ATP-binding cassette domain-containing protein n=1 Tax=Vibrio sonorensis TaxID=1004316 RepID=UPI0008DB175D|nr:ATP-binding cassette domain-containing protein [Vibrio sonorensis]
MPTFLTSQLGFNCENGTPLFQNVSLSLSSRRIGLVGRNGVGKSVLASLLCKDIEPCEGSVNGNLNIAIYRQQTNVSVDTQTCIAEFLGVKKVLDALDQIEQGCCDPQVFERVAEQWTLRDEVTEILQSMGIDCPPSTLCQSLSGGQLTRLQLWSLFQNDRDLLILDEPSNHLDSVGKKWLLDLVHSYTGAILLISHDRELLRAMDTIWKLDSKGVQEFGGNYDYYAKQFERQKNALDKQLENAEKEQKKLERVRQKNLEKAQQRSAVGKQARRRGDQPKILLNGLKNSAEQSAGVRVRQEQKALKELNELKHSLRDSQAVEVLPKIHLQNVEQKKKPLLTLWNLVLPFGSTQPISFQCSNGDKLYLGGRNGSGKSTLLKIISGEVKGYSGDLRVNGEVCYLDQHFSMDSTDPTLLEFLMSRCAGTTQTDARTLLAGIGFRRDEVLNRVSTLSGGQKMKLSILAVSHRQDQPFLLLDEPNNHLDLESQQVLASALKQYKGGFILVSHDADFVEDLNITQSVCLE